MVDQQRVSDIMNLTAWTLQVSMREGKPLLALGAVFQTLLIKKPFAQEAGCCFFSHLSPTAQTENTSLCLT